MNANTPIAKRLWSNKDFEPTKLKKQTKKSRKKIAIAAEQLELIVNNMCSDSITKSFDFPDNDDYLNNILIDEDENHAAENWIERSNPVSSFNKILLFYV
ncbi:hypothetical protein BpHYR1_012081 [Brachionus plicatilis]|uniref:Uncharacterized protein n=1 Tax=Brachionus plicatilis TaxID=10195 RepID=A0A3M7SSB6_BRAPC|nr:hypothetical protein BpHYR1_012081 [Brachionus plicatilis]